MFVHKHALCESTQVGKNTRIWAFAHVMRDAVVGVDCNIGEGVFVESGAVIGNRVTLKNQVMVWDGVTLEDDVFIGPGAIFTNDMQPRSPRGPAAAKRYEQPQNWLRATRVCQGASVGAGAILLPGITLGQYCLVGAGAVVTSDLFPHQLVVGNPARVIGLVCECGLRLNEQQVCTSCNREFSLADFQLKPGG